MEKDNNYLSNESKKIIEDMIERKHYQKDHSVVFEATKSDENDDNGLENGASVEDVEKTLECRYKKTKNKEFLKRSKAIIVATLLASGIGVGAVSCNKNENENKDTEENQNDDKKFFTKIEEVTTAIVTSDGKIELSSDEVKNDSDIFTIAEENNIVTNSENNSEMNSDDKEVSSIRTVVTAKDVTKIVNDYYGYLNERIEDKSNDISIGALYSTVWLANSQFISVDETNKLIESGLIPNDLTTLKTEVDAIVAVITSENATKIAVSEAFKTELDINKLINISSIFIDETDISVSEYSEQQYLKLISSDSVYADNGSIILSNQKKIFDIYENIRNFFNNTTKYDFSEINDSEHFRHDYPVNFVQSSIGAQYLIESVIGVQTVSYATGTGSVLKDESKRFQRAMDNDVEGSISYLNDKFNGVCFDNDTIKTYVK